MRQANGYGTTKKRRGSQKSRINLKSHRLSAAIHGVNIDGVVIRHSCDNRACVNPAHLIAGTQSENVKDMILRGRQAKGGLGQKTKLTEDDVKKIIKDNRFHKEIAKSFGVSRTAIDCIKRGSTWSHVTGIKKVNNRARGERHPFSKLTKSDVDFIRSSSETSVNLASMMGLSHHLIMDIHSRRSWKHVP